MALSLQTFGSAPAAIYLVELLNERNNERLTRKVSRTLSNQREVLKDLTCAHLCGVMSLSSFCALLELMSKNNQAEVTKAIATEDQFIANLVVNVLEGGVKAWKRRAQEAARQRSTIARKTPAGQSVEDPLANWLDDEKTPADLIKRSKAYLARKGKKDTLY
jgi:hypothetical protein